MILDKFLEFLMVSKGETSVTPTRELPMGQGDLAGDTKGMGPYQGLFIVVTAANDVPAGLVVTVQDSDTEGGAYANVIAFPATTAVTKAGRDIIKHPVPFDIRNWVRFTLSSAEDVNIFMTTAVDKPYPGLLN
jgi:hypothetical protein